MDTLAGKKILVTSGPTRVPLDAVRFLSSRSSGRLGAEIARELLASGARVTFLYGAESMRPDPGEGVHLIEVETVDELIRAIKDLGGKNFDAIFHAMAVSDFAPENVIKGKVSSQKEETWNIKLIKTPKVIKLIRELWPNTTLVGFKLEVGQSREELLTRARNFATDSGVDLVVVNDLTEITGDRHVAHIVSNKGDVVEAAHTKKEIAAKLVRLVEKKLTGPEAPFSLRSP